MSSFKILVAVLSLLLLVGCLSASRDSRPATQAQEPLVSEESIRAASGDVQIQKVSLQDADQSQVVGEVVDRKIIRNADISVEVGSPTDAQRQITSIAESQGGFVVTSELKQRPTSDPNRREIEATLVVRIPSSRFETALSEIRSIGSRVIHEKVAAQDVTEEFIDLEARIKTQRSLETQFLEIMKQANKIPEALEVQRQIAEVRTEIEKLEGRKRFLENRASLSTITVSLQPPTSIVVSTSGFGRELKEAVSDSIGIASGILLFLVRFVIMMIPVFLLIFLPLGLVLRYFIKRLRRIQLARQLQSVTQPD